MLAFEEVQRGRVKGTARSVINKVLSLSLEELEAGAYITATDELSRELVEKYENQIFLAKIDSDKFRTGLYKFFQQTAGFIRHKKLVQNYFDFCYFVYTELNSREDFDKRILYLYQNMLMQQATHLYNEKWVYGIMDKDTILTQDEVYPKLDYPMYEMMQVYGRRFEKAPDKSRLTEKTLKLYKKYGYAINNREEALEYILNEQSISRQIFQMVPFINETTLDIYCQDNYKPLNGINIIDNCLESDELADKIRAGATYVLPFKGLKIKCKNCGDVTEVLLKERIYSNRLHLLFKITVGGKGCYNGFWDMENNLSFTHWRDSHESICHKLTMGLVQQLYSSFIGVDTKDIIIRIVEYIDKEEGTEPVAQFIENVEARGDYVEGKRLDKSNYMAMESTVAPFIRKLRDGQKASDEAVQRALDVGYILKDGETFVRKHKRTVYKSKKIKRGIKLMFQI